MKNKKNPVWLLAVLLLISSPLYANPFSKGDKVEALWHGAWYKATIEHIPKEGLYKVHFYGYWASREEFLTPDRIRKIPERAYINIGDLKSGDAVEFHEGDHWRPATFIEEKEKKALLRYADGEKMREEWIPIQRVWKNKFP